MMELTFADVFFFFYPQMDVAVACARLDKICSCTVISQVLQCSSFSSFYSPQLEMTQNTVLHVAFSTAFLSQTALCLSPFLIIKLSLKLFGRLVPMNL